MVSVALIRDPPMGEKLLEEGVLTLSPPPAATWPTRTGETRRQGRGEEEILPCISCMACFGKYERQGTYLRGEPGEGYEAQRCPPLPRDGEGRLVVVLGVAPPDRGGLGGHRRGFRVILFEKAPQLGGQLRRPRDAPEARKFSGFWTACAPLPPGGGGAADRLPPTLKELGRLSPMPFWMPPAGGDPGRDPGAGRVRWSARRRRSSPAPWTSGRRAWWWWARG